MEAMTPERELVKVSLARTSHVQFESHTNFLLRCLDTRQMMHIDIGTIQRHAIT